MRKENIDLRNEHEGLRNRVGYYDFTHDLVEVTGQAAGDFLEIMFVNSIRKAEINDAIYTTMLNEEGIIIDDVIVFRIEAEKFWISTLYLDEMITWFDEHSEGFDIEYKGITETTTMYAIQGPNSLEVMNDFLEDNIDELRDMSIRDNKVGDVPVKVARCGFTGELGYELYFEPEHIELIEDHLQKSGEQFDIVEMKTDVILSSLPTEKGYILMRDLAGTNPLEAGFGWSVDWSKEFIGKGALEKVKEAGAKRSLLGFTVEDDAAEVEEGTDVKVDGEIVGKVTNFTYGFTVEKNIGFALVDNSLVKVGDPVTIDSEAGEVKATLTERIFYDVENERRRGMLNA